MKFITEFRDRAAAQALAREIGAITEGFREIRIMEVCGGHTMSIYKYGLRDLLPSNIRLISGPGCPVCVTSNVFIDTALALARRPEVIITSFGDLIRVPGSRSSLLREKGQGADVRICYSPMDALEIARANPDKQVVFLGVGFETTAPTAAAAVKHARTAGIRNFSLLSAFKTMPDAMKALVSSGDLALDAFICPGHVSVITGTGMYEFLAREYRTPCVVSGFEPVDLLQAILMIVKQVREGRAEVENQYSRTVTREGNAIAQALLKEVFVESDVEWRGLGTISGSGLALSPAYAEFDVTKRIPLEIEAPRESPGCICGSIMRGVKTPRECKLFKRACTPESPKGACMVSDEGTCASAYKYGG